MKQLLKDKWLMAWLGLFLSVCLFLCFPEVRAFQVTGSGISTPPGGGGTYYYRGGTTDVYTNTTSATIYNTYRIGDTWTPGVTKSITKIGAKIGAADLTGITVVLWSVSGGTYTLERCVTIASPTSGWNDGNITAYSLGSGTQIAITWIPASDSTNTYYYAAESGGYFSTGNTYANECSLETISHSDEWQYGVRFYGE